MPKQSGICVNCSASRRTAVYLFVPRGLWNMGIPLKKTRALANGISLPSGKTTKFSEEEGLENFSQPVATEAACGIQNASTPTQSAMVRIPLHSASCNYHATPT